MKASLAKPSVERFEKARPRSQGELDALRDVVLGEVRCRQREHLLAERSATPLISKKPAELRLVERHFAGAHETRAFATCFSAATPNAHEANATSALALGRHVACVACQNDLGELSTRDD